MGLSRVTTWNTNDVLTSAALNAEFNNLLNNALSLVSPLTGNLDFGGYRAITMSAGSVGSPSVQPTGDTNTGIYFASADFVDIAAGGVRVASFAQDATSGSLFGFGTVPDARFQFLLGGSFTAVGASSVGLLCNTALTAAANSTIAQVYIDPTITTPASGTHGVLSGLYIETPAVTSGGATVTRAATLYIGGAATIGSTANYSLWVDAGSSKFDSYIMMGPNETTTGATAGDIIMSNTNIVSWMNAAGTSTSNCGIVVDANDDMSFAVPAATDIFAFGHAGSAALEIVNENGGAGILFMAESSSQHTAPAANRCTLYLADAAGMTTLYAVFSDNVPQAIAAQQS